MKVEISNYKDSSDDRDVHIEIVRHDLISLDSTLALILVPVLKKFRDTTFSIPTDLTNSEGTSQNWHNVLDHMIWSFQQVADGKHYKHHDAEWYQKLQEGFDLFAKYYLDLWI